MIRDLELIRTHTHPERVAALVLAGVTTTSSEEVEWLTYDVGRIFPQEWERLENHIPSPLKGMRIVDAYATLLFDDDPLVGTAAAAEWCLWEESHISLVPGYTRNRRLDDPDFQLRFARFVTHYWRNAAFLPDDELIRNAATLKAIPGALLHGRYDVSSPLSTAWRLHKRWSGSELHVVDDAGHGGGSWTEQIVAVLDRFKVAID